MHRIRARVPLFLASLGLAAVAASPPCFAPVEIEPNDDVEAEDYAGNTALPAAPFLVTVEGTLSGPSDSDVYSFHTAAGGSAVVLLTGAGPTVTFQAIHPQADPWDQVADAVPYALRLVPQWTLFPDSEERPNFAGMLDGGLEGERAYELFVASPGARSTHTTAKCVAKSGEGNDSFKARLAHAPALGLGPGDTQVRIHVRDATFVIAAGEFVTNGSGTRHTWRGTSGLRKVTWDTRRGVVTLLGKGFDFPSMPTEGSLPVAVLSDRGGVADDLNGVRKETRTAARITAKRR